MYIYFNKLGELTTIIPHGEIVRQGTWFTLNVALDKDVDMSNLNMWFRFKRRGNERFVGDENYQGHFDMIKSGIQTFHKVEPKEATFDLVDGQDYAIFTYKVSTDTGLTAIDGNVEIVFTLTEQVTSEDGQQVTEDVKMQGRANIYVEPTYGLHPERGLDLSVSEYATIMQTINQLQNSLKVTNITIVESTNVVNDTEYQVTITYNDKAQQTFRSMFLEKYLSDATVDTTNMQLTIVKSDGTELEFEGLTAEKVLEVINANSILGQATVVLKKSTDDGINRNSDVQTLTNKGIYQYFGAYLIALPQAISGTLTKQQYYILSNNSNALLTIGGNIYTLIRFKDNKIYYHYLSGSGEDFVIVNQDYTWTTEHVTFNVGDLAEQISQLKLDLLAKVDKLQTISAYPKAYVEYTEDGEIKQGSIPIDDGKSGGSIARRLSTGELAIVSYWETQSYMALSIGQAKNHFLQMKSIPTDWLSGVYGADRQSDFDYSKRTPIFNESVNSSSASQVQEIMENNETIFGLTRIGSIKGTFISATYENGIFKATSTSNIVGIGFKVEVKSGERYRISNLIGENIGNKYITWIQDGSYKYETYSIYFDSHVTGFVFFLIAPNKANEEMTINSFDITKDTEQVQFQLTDKAIPNTAVKRNANGSFEVPTPQTDSEVAPKAYVDTKLDKVTTESTLVQLYAKFASGGQGMVSIAMDAPRGGTIVQRDDEGKIKTANPVDPTDAVNLQTLESKISTVYKYKGSVDNYSDLPTENNQVGDVYNIVNADPTHDIQAGDNVAWNGTTWDKLGGDVDLSNYVTQDQLSNYAEKTDLETKLDKVTITGAYRAYIIKSNGEQDVANLSRTPPTSDTYTVPWYSQKGTLQSNNPTLDLDVVNKQTMETALDGKLNKDTTADDTERLYGVSETGEQIMIISTTEDVADTIVRRTADGKMVTAEEPTDDQDVTNKVYVDNKAKTKLTEITSASTYNQAYVKTASGKQSMFDIAITPTNNAIVRYGSTGNVQTNDPTNDLDAINLKYFKNNLPTPTQIALTGTSGTLTDAQYTSLFTNILTYITLNSSVFKRTRTETNTLTYGNQYVLNGELVVEEIKISTDYKTWALTQNVLPNISYVVNTDGTIDVTIS